MSKLIDATFAAEGISFEDLDSLDATFMSCLTDRDQALIELLRTAVDKVDGCERELDESVAQLSAALGRVRGQRAQGNRGQLVGFMVVDKAQRAERDDYALRIALTRLETLVKMFAELLKTVDTDEVDGE